MQGESLNIDRRGFYNQLYAALDAVCAVPLCEEEPPEDSNGETLSVFEQQLAASEESFADQLHRLQGTSSEIPLLLCRLLELMILDAKLLDATRQAAFAKRIACTAGVFGDTGTGMGLLCVLQRMLRRQPKLRGMLENEAGGPSAYKTFNPEVADPAEAGALSSALWELPLLARHFHPHISQVAKDISGGHGSGSGGAAGSALLPLGTSPADLARQYSTAHGGFRPPPRQPTASKAGLKRERVFSNKKGEGEEGVEAFLVTLQKQQVEVEEESEDDVAEALVEHFKTNKHFSVSTSNPALLRFF